MVKTMAMIWKAPPSWEICRVRSGVRAVHAPSFPRGALEHIVRISDWDGKQGGDGEWEHELVKDSKSSVYRVSDGRRTYYAKHYTNHAIGEVVKAILRPPIRSVAVAAALQKDHIPVPAPVAALTIRRGLAEIERVFVCCEEPGKLLRCAMADGDLGRKRRARVAKAMGLIWGKMLSCGYLHMDPITGNFIYNPDVACNPITLIDLDNIYRVSPWILRSHLPFARKRLAKFVYRLSRQLVEQGEPPIRLDEFRFFRRAYIAAGGPEIPNARQWWQDVSRMVQKRWYRRFGQPYPQLPH